MARQPIAAVSLDAMGTLLTFDPPAPLLRSALREDPGIAVADDVARDAIRAEIAFYRAHMHTGRDAASVAALRRASAEAMRPVLRTDAHPEALTGALMAALRFRAYPDAVPALRALRECGLRLVVASNWDFSLHERLEETGLAGLVDGAVASAELGVAKPDAALFAAALARVGAAPGVALHVGDHPREDVEGARAAGLAAALLVRNGTAPPVPDGVPVLASLEGVPALCAYPPSRR